MILSLIAVLSLTAAGPGAEAEAGARPPVPAGYRVLLEEDFGSGARSWGRVETTGGALLVKGEVMVPVSWLSDAVIEYRARCRGEGILNLRFRYDLDQYVFYMLRLDARSEGGNPPGFLKRDATERWWHTCGERLLDRSLAPDTWVNVRLVLRGSRFEAFLDGEPAATLEDPEYGRGFLVFNNELQAGEVDWVRVSVPEDSAATLLGITPPREREPEPFSRGEWTAEWIWLPGPTEALVRYFRRAFDLPAEPGAATLAVTCDNRYEVWLNDRRVGSDGDWYRAESHDVTGLVRKGRNLLAVIGQNDEPGAAGLLLELGVSCTDGSYVNIHTDATWKASPEGLNGWSGPELDDGAWAQATSLGPHPQQPWAGQSALAIPYLGPKQPLRLVRLEVPGEIAIGEPFPVQATFIPPKALAHDYPLEVFLRRGGDEQRIALVQPETPASRWPAGRQHQESLTVKVRADVGYVLDEGPCEVGARLLGTFEPGNPAPTRARLVRGQATRFVGLRKPNPDGSPVTAGVLLDAAGGKHPWELAPDGSISLDGTTYAVLPGSGGVYFCRLDDAARRALAPLDWPAQGRRLCAEGGPVPEDIVRVRLADWVDCSGEDHQFSEDAGLGGRSRVVEIGDRRYRVTCARKKTSYFAYSLECGAPRDPHLMLFQTPNDRERNTTVRIQPPWDNVGGGVYTGREYPCDGKPVECLFLFYPRDRDIRATVSSVPSYDSFDELTGAAVSNLWLFELEDALAARPLTVLAPDGEQRKLGLYLTHPMYCYTLYGFPRGDEALRLASVKSFRDYLGFCGINLFELNAVDGGDTTSAAYYPSRLWRPEPGNLLAELLDLVAPTGVDIVPIVTSLNAAEGKFGFTRDSFQTDRFGNLSYFFDTRPPLPDPLRPEVQQALLDTLREILDLCGKNPAVPAVGFRVNGKIGLCYAGSQQGQCDQYTGYSEWDVEQFRRATGIEVPAGLEPTAYEWIREHCWEEWLAWRCRETAKLWRQARDLVRSYRPDLLLMASCDMPSETPAWNLYWPEGETPLRCMIYHGVDPRLYRDEEGLVLQRGMMVAADRYFTGHGQYDTNHWAHKTFHYAPGVAGMYGGRHGAWCELYHNYWEEFGIFPQGEFQTDFWGAATMAPWGRYFFEPVAFSIFETNAYAINLFSWERGSFAHEHDLRAFARAFRALPMAPGEDASRHVQLVKPARIQPTGTRATGKPEAPTAPEGEGLWARWFGDRLALCNFSPSEVTVRVTWPGALGEGQELVEAAGLALLAVGPRDSVELKLTLAPYELRTLVQRAR